MSRRTIDLILFALLASLWGGSFVAIKFVVRDMAPVTGAFFRVAVACVILTVVFARRDTSATRAERRRMWIAGVFTQGIPFSLLFWGEQRLSPGVAGIINGTVPLWSFLMTLQATDEALSPRKIAGLLLGFGGIVAVCWPVMAGGEKNVLAVLAVTGMAVSYAIGGLLTKRVLTGPTASKFRANALNQQMASAVFLLIATLLIEGRPNIRPLWTNPTTAAAIFYLGAFSTAGAFLIYYHLIREWGAVKASSVTYVAPIMAMVWDFLFFRNAPDAVQFLGAAMTLGGVWILNRRA